MTIFSKASAYTTACAYPAIESGGVSLPCVSTGRASSKGVYKFNDHSCGNYIPIRKFTMQKIQIGQAILLFWSQPRGSLDSRPAYPLEVDLGMGVLDSKETAIAIPLLLCRLAILPLRT